MNMIYNIDIFEYITSHINISDYDKLKKVSVNFKSIFDINSKDYKDLICIKGCDIKTIMSIIEKRAVNKYPLSKSRIINKSLLHYYWFYSDYDYDSITKYFDKVIMSDCGIYIEYLIALLYNCEYSKHKNIIDIFDNVSKNLALFPINTVEMQVNIFRLIKSCCLILNLQNKRERTSIYTNRYTNRYIIYNTNIGIYITILVKAIQTDINTRGTLIRPGFKKLFLVANEKKEYYKNCINDNPRFSKIFPKYYLKYIIDIIEKNII